MPGKVKVKIVSGRNLPIMDRSNLTTDAYVEVKLGSTIYKTDVYRKSLNPVWNSEWFRFEMDDLELQDEPLQIRLMDHDTYSSNDAIGKVYLDLNPLLCNSSRGKDTSGKMISGWIPVYDTMHGIRGEVNLIVKVELFSDLNKFRQSSCGVRFFFTQSVPEGYVAHIMQGFVEELVVNDDPEYQWIDKIRTPRASNEARQTLFSKLSGEVQRRVGLKALELGGNAVIGYKQCFDLEGESGIVVRGIGTAAYLTKQYESQLSPTCGESVGMSREFAELQGYRSFAKSGRSLRRRGGPGRAPRLQRRSFRVANSSDSMSILHQHNLGGGGGGEGGGMGKKNSYDDTCLTAHAHPNNYCGGGGHMMMPKRMSSGAAIAKHGSFEAFNDRSSFRENSLKKLVKLKSLTSSTHSVPPTSSSGTNKGACSCRNEVPVKTSLIVTTSEPCIEVSSGERVTACPSITTVPTHSSQMKSISLNPTSAFRSRSASRLPLSSSPSPFRKAVQVECSTHANKEGDCRLSGRDDYTSIYGHNSFEEPCRSKSALASCMVHHRTYSETMSPAKPSNLNHEGDRSKSVTELNTRVAIVENAHLIGFMGSGAEFESAGSNLDSNADEESTSDTSMRYLYCTEPLNKARIRPEVGFDSDTSKDIPKASSGNEGYTIDNDDLSPVSEREGFLLLRKKRGSRRKDRYSKSSLMKRASATFADRGYFFGGTERIREEVVKFFKRKKSSDDNESCSSSTTKTTASSVKKCNKPKSSPYREAKFFFRRRRTTSNTTSIPFSINNPLRSRTSGQLFRSNSDSHSIGQTSLDSVPSVGSEPLFDPEDEDSSLDPAIGGAVAVSTSTTELFIHEKVTAAVVPKLQIPEVDEEEKENNLEDCSMNIINIDPRVQLVETLKSCSTSNHGNVLQMSQSKVVEIIKELGYSTESPLKLYISSMDALLVYEPDSACGAGTLSTDYVCDDRDGGGDSASPACSHSSPAAFNSVASRHSSAAANDICGSSCVVDGSSTRAGSCCNRANCRFGKILSCATFSKYSPAIIPPFKQEASFLKGARSSVSQFSDSEMSVPVLSSFSSSQILGTTDSFTTSASESSSNFSSFRKCPVKCLNEEEDDDDDDENDIIFPLQTSRLINQVKDDDNNFACTCTGFPSTSRDALKNEARQRFSPCPIHTQTHDITSTVSSNQEQGHYDCDDNKYLLGGVEDERILLCSRSSAISNKSPKDTNYVSDDDILVVTETNSSCIIEGRGTVDRCRSYYSSVGFTGNVDDEKDESCKSCLNLPEKMAVPSNRSPIPEELLCDRSTPTLCNINQLGNTLTGGISNCSISTVTNILSSQHGPSASSTVIQTNNGVNNMSNSTSFNNNPGGAVTMVVNNSSSTTTTISPNTTSSTNSTNLNTNSTMASGVGSKRLVGTYSEDNASMVTRHDNGAHLDDTAKGSSLSPSSSTPIPQNPSIDPYPNYNNQQHANGVQQNNRPHLQHQIQVEGEPQEWDQANVNKQPPKSAGYAANSKMPSTMLPFGQPHAHMTTTIITTGTGTMPIMGGAPLHRRSSESDLSTPPKITASTAHIRGFSNTPGLKPGGITTTIDQYGLMEYPFITISQFPPGFLTHIGGTVTARSVKLLERISNLDEPESRDAWWNEIRMEIRAHCRAFGCTVVVGYEEHTTMCDDVCVLSASGTAAIAATTIGLKNVELLTVSTKQGTTNPVIADAPIPGRGVEKDRNVLTKMDNVINTGPSNGAFKHILVTPSKLRHDSDLDPNCSMLHIPSNPAGLPFPVKMSKCHICRKGRVPDVLIVTVEIPPGLHVTGKGTLIQAQVFRPKKDCKGEISAKEVSDSLPFLEYELHRRLINKLKVKGMNAIFGLKVQICLGDKLMVALATGTGMYVSALPPPGVPIITAGNLKTDAQKVLQYQKVVQDAYDRNRQHYDLKSVPIPSNGRQSGSSGEESEEDENADLPTTTKDTYILEVDDAEDIDIISMLIDPQPTSAFLMNNIDYLHGYEEYNVSSQQMFTQVWRCRIPTLSLRQFTAYFERLLRSVCFKLRKMMPCVLSKLSFRVELPEPDEMQISIIGIALGMMDQSKLAASEKSNSVKSGSALSVAKEEGELIFPLEEDTSGGQNANSGLNQPKSGDTSVVPGGDGSSKDLYRGTPPPHGILVPATSQVNNSNVILVPRYLPHQPCNISSSPHSHCSSHLSGNGCPNTINVNAKTKLTVEITPLSYIPGARIEKYLGNLNFFFIRETTSIRENGGLSGFVHNFVAEVLAIVRAHVAALGGNAMVSYFMTELALLHNPHKNQGQCLINVGGDVVLIVHPSSVSEQTQLCS